MALLDVPEMETQLIVSSPDEPASAERDEPTAETTTAVVDVEGLSEGDWCLYHRIPDVIQELAYNIVLDRPEDVERYARSWLVDLQRLMVLNGNATSAQGINLSSVSAQRGLHLGGDPTTGHPGIQIIEPDVAARAQLTAASELNAKVSKAQRRSTKRRQTRAMSKALTDKHRDLIEKMSKLKNEEVAEVSKFIDSVVARRGSRPQRGPRPSAFTAGQAAGGVQHNRMFDQMAAAAATGNAGDPLAPGAVADPAVSPAAGSLADPLAQSGDAPTSMLAPAVPKAAAMEKRAAAGRRRIAVSNAPVGSDAVSNRAAVEDMPVVPKSESELAELREAMRACTAFNNFDSEELGRIIDVMHRESFAGGTQILVQGQPGRDTFYLIISGTVEIVKSGKVVAKMTHGNYFGELELMYAAGDCAATVKSITNLEAYALRKDTYQVLLLRQTMAMRERNRELIEHVDFFRDLSEYHKMVLAEAFNTKTYNDGDKIIRRGETGEYMHVVVEGEVIVFGREEGTDKPYEIIRRHDGDVIGELEFLFKHEAVADVVANGVVRAARLGRRHFESAIGKTADVLAAQIARGGYDDYLKRADDHVKKQIAASERKSAKRAVVDPNAQSMRAAGKSKSRSPVQPQQQLPAESMIFDTSSGAMMSDDTAGDFKRENSLSAAAVSTLVTTPPHPNGEVVFGSSDTSGYQTLYRFPLDPFQDENVCLCGMQEDGTVLHWSEGMIKTTGYSASEVVGRPIFNLMPQQQHQQTCFELINAAKEWAGDWDGFQDTGNHRREGLVFTQSSQMSNVTLLVTVIPSLVEHEASQVVLMVGHELKRKPPIRTVEFAPWFMDTFTPQFKEAFSLTHEALNPMKLFEGILPPPQQLQQMRELWTLCRNTVDQFEPLARVDATSLVDNWQAANLETIMRRIQMNLAAELAQRHHQLAVDLSPELEKSEVFVDVKRLPDVITYLVNHASKGRVGVSIAIKARCVRVEQQLMEAAERRKRLAKADGKSSMTAEEREAKHETAPGGAHYIPADGDKKSEAPQGKSVDLLEFVVEDDGAGEEASGTRKSGKGLGLAQANRYVSAMGGTIEITTEGFATRATIALPLVEASKSTAAAADGNGATFTTVLVEGDTVQRNFFCQYLWGRKHAVLPANTWNDLLTMLKSSPVDIVMIDPEAVLDENVMVSMQEPTKSPLEMLRQYTAKSVVVLTSDTFDDDTVAQYEAEGVLALAKPSTAPRMHVVVEKAEAVVLKDREEMQKINEIRETFNQTNRGAWRKGRLLGKGAFGEVFEAIDVLTGGKMAVKIMKSNEDNKALMEEIRTMTKLQHENIIHYFYCEEKKDDETGREDILIFMELAAGGVLQDRVKKFSDGLDKETLCATIRQILAGLQYIHDVGSFVHCDIKSANVLIDAEDHYKLGDFGTAKRLGPGQKLYETRGTPLYMAPEVWNASPGDENGEGRCGFDQSADIWSLGCMVMEMATGKSPFAHLGTPVTVMNRISALHGTDDAPDLSPLFKLDVQVFEFIRACLEVDPEKRPRAIDLQAMPLVTESGDTSAAMRVLQKAELMHHLLKFVAFESPPGSDDEEADAEFFQKFAKKTDDADDFFDSDDEDEDEDEDEDDDGDVFSKPAAEVSKPPSAPAAASGAPSFTPLASGGNDDDDDDDDILRPRQVTFMGASASRSGKTSNSLSSGHPTGPSDPLASSSVRREANPFHAPRRGHVGALEEVDLNDEDDD